MADIEKIASKLPLEEHNALVPLRSVPEDGFFPLVDQGLEIPSRPDLAKDPDILEKISSFWADRWQDKRGDRWQVIPMEIDYDDAPQYLCKGDIIRNGQAEGRWTRRLILEEGKESIDHVNCEIDKSVRGLGFARTWLSRCAHRYDAWGISYALVAAGYEGMATWPRLGFDLRAPKDLDVYAEPSSYQDSDYASKMRDIYQSVELKISIGHKSGAIDENEADKLRLLIKEISKEPMALPQFCQTYPQFSRRALRSAGGILQASTEDLLKLSRPRISGFEASESPEEKELEAWQDLSI